MGFPKYKYGTHYIIETPENLSKFALSSGRSDVHCLSDL